MLHWKSDMIIRSGFVLALFAASIYAAPALAAVSAQEGDRLGKDLTPLGGERAGNADGSIPVWNGGLTKAPPCYKGKGHRYCDPFVAEKPLLTITGQNAAQYRNQLSAGQLEMLRRYPGYRIRVFPTHRTSAVPDFVVKATRANATRAQLISDGEGIAGAAIGIPFPIPKTGVEPVWNHKLRYRGVGGRRWNTQIPVMSNGSYVPAKLREDARFEYSRPEATPESINNVAIYFLQVTMAPPRLAGTIGLIHETMDQIKEARRVWAYNGGQRRLRRAPSVAYDNPGQAADGLRTNDQTDTFNGATDRYTWKLLGKREMFVPYNAYRLHSSELKYKDIVHKDHINPDLARYERHRVWVVEANVKPTTSHMYARRVFYIDEDSWQIVLVDIYDQRGKLWRWQEAHAFQAYDVLTFGSALETVYDLTANRYLAMALNNEDEMTVERDFPLSYFDPANVVRHAMQ
jgi:hypothetical protein